MSKASKIVSSDIVGADFKLVEVNGNMYPVKPPTINRVAGAVACLSGLALNDGKTIRDILPVNEDNIGKYARALSFLIQDDYDLTEELSKGRCNEVVEAICIAFGMISGRSFSIAASLAKSASALVAKSLR